MQVDFDFLSKIYRFFRKMRLRLYKNKKVNRSKTKHDRIYYLKFLIHLNDPQNPQVSETEYQMMIPAKAAFFAKGKLEDVIIEKLRVQVNSIEEVSEDDYQEFLDSEREYAKKKKAQN